MQIVVGNLPQTKGEIADEMHGRNDLEHGQFGNRCERVGNQRERCRPRPSALERDLFKAILDQFANSRGAVDMGNDLEQKVRRRQ
jgi:hypothetical protein